MRKEYAFTKKTDTNPTTFYWFNRAFSYEELNKIYNDLNNVPFERAAVINDNGKVRRSNIKWIPKTEQWDWLYFKLMELAQIANDECWQFDLHTAPEMIQYTEYDAEELGHYDWHQDIGPGVPSLRKVSITVQLSEADEYEGGDLHIWLGGDMSNSDIGPRGAGNVVIFPSYMPHRVAPVTKGIRRSFVLWLGGEHYK
jgi:PKHD-type hydroxylase